MHAFDRRFERFAELYHATLASALDRRARVVGVTIVVFTGAILLGLALDRGVLPDVDQGAFRVRLELERGTPLEETIEATDRLERRLLEEPDVAAVFSQVGRRAAVAGVPDEASGLHTALLDIRLESGAATADVVERIRPALAEYPPGAVVIETGQATALGQLLGGGEADLAVRVQGEELDRMLAYAGALESRLAEIPSLTNVRVGTELGQPEIQVEIDRDRAAAFGIAPAAVARSVEAFMRGTQATEYVAFDRKIPVIVRLPEAARRSLETLNVLNVGSVPLREVVRTREALGPTEIRRLEQTRFVPVYADVASGGLAGALADVSEAVATEPAPAGLRTQIGGENEEMRESFRELGFAFLLALLLVYMIMAAQFESFVQPFTVLLAVPLASIGAIGALWLAGAGLNTMSLIGFVILVGIVVNDAIIKVDFINQARERGLPLRDAILEAGRVRLRPIVMTTVTTVLGLTPMALGIGRGADLRAPLAIAVIGGLITATALTLIVVPVAYDLIEDARRRVLG
ncbi:MAG: efflux RND transporter permease subunit, partial [Gemmatimonadota bacterium]